MPPQTQKEIEGFNKELTKLHPDLSSSPSIKYEKFIIFNLINERKPRLLQEYNRLNMPPQMRKGIEGFNKELTKLCPVLSSSPSIKYEKFIISHSINERKPLLL